MPVPLMRIETTPVLPREADVVVIGGGVIGVFSAYYLARRGVRVALVEKGMIGGEQSSRNWGWVRQQNRDARELGIATQSLDLWQRLPGEIGEDPGFKRCGLLYLSNDEEEIARWAKWRDFARTVGVTTHMLSGAEADARGGATGQRWKGGVHAPMDGISDPSRAAPVVAKGIMQAGGTVHQMCAARGLEMEAGHVSGVVTEHGTIRTRSVVMAGGAWASSFCRQLGVRFPQATLRSTVLSFAPGVEDIPYALHTADITITRRGDAYTAAIGGRGRIDPTPQQIRYSREFVPMFVKRRRSLRPGGLGGWKAGHESLAKWRLDAPTPMERNRTLDPRPDDWQLRESVRRACRLVPALSRAPVAAAWAGYIDTTPDGIPAIGPVASVPGLTLAAGLSGHGFGISPGVGSLVADLVTGRTPRVDPVPYDPARFRTSSWGKVADF